MPVKKTNSSKTIKSKTTTSTIKRSASSKKMMCIVSGAHTLLGRKLIQKIQKQYAAATVYAFLPMEVPFQDKIEEELQNLVTDQFLIKTIRVKLSEDYFGLDPKDYKELANNLNLVWHLNLEDNLYSPYSEAYDRHYLGTLNIIRLCKSSKTFKQLHYVSTTAVSGDRAGLILESELDMGQKHLTTYESTMFLAELAVQKMIKEGFPATIYRPGLIIGDSQTGEWMNNNAFYLLIQAIDELIRLPFGIPRIFNPDHKIALVPIDYLTEVLYSLSTKKEAIGETFHIVDPDCPNLEEIYKQMVYSITGKYPSFQLSPFLIQTLSNVPLLKKFVKIHPDLFTFLRKNAIYSMENMQNLLGTSAPKCPPLMDYFPMLFDYWKKSARG